MKNGRCGASPTAILTPGSEQLKRLILRPLVVHVRTNHFNTCSNMEGEKEGGIAEGREGRREVYRVTINVVRLNDIKWYKKTDEIYAKVLQFKTKL